MHYLGQLRKKCCPHLFSINVVIGQFSANWPGSSSATVKKSFWPGSTNDKLSGIREFDSASYKSCDFSITKNTAVKGVNFMNR